MGSAHKKTATGEAARPLKRADSPVAVHSVYHQPTRLLGLDRRRIRLGSLIALKRQQFLTEDRHITRGLNAQPNFTAVDIHHRDADVFADVDFLTQFPTQD